MARRALVTGISGQDVAYLSKILLAKGYEVFGTVRPGREPDLWRLDALGLAEDVRIIPLDILGTANIVHELENIGPDEIYNFAAQSRVALSFLEPVDTSEVGAMGTAHLLEAIRIAGPEARFYQASTSEMFGIARESPQNERTPFHPRSPYAAAKAFGHWITVNYREAFDLHASSGILFNHESPLRGPEFVTRKITRGLARIRAGAAEPVLLGNLEARRDWGYAGDYAAGIWSMLQQPEPDDYVLATGRQHSVRDFVETACQAIGFDIVWQGSGGHSQGVDRRTDNVLVRVDATLYRPAEPESLVGDSSHARERLGWKPEKTFEDLVGDMVRADLDRVSVGALEV